MRTIIYTLAAVMWIAAVPAARPGDDNGFQLKPLNDRSLGVYDDERPVLVYNHGITPKSELPGSRERSTYVHPIYGLDGEVLTDDFPKDHVHHRGLYWAWPHIRIDGQEYDLWNLSGIRYEFRKWLMREAKRDSATLAARNAWLVADREVMREEVRIRVHRATTDSRAVDVTLKWTPIDRAITLQGAEGKSYGGLNLRYGPRSRTLITGPEGIETEDLLITRLPWADFSGDFSTPGKLSGIALFVHPSHPDYPPTWMTRHYGLLSVGWPGVSAQTFAPGKSFTCQYRLWIHRGAPAASEIQRAYDAFARS